ncbi:hypothetical protein Q4F19_20695 [Sphingomonas sp. BIUV-7]|uniref:DUF1330 domain-containing protein n=1 Tax=Sphingomonas natans TaxID=3063330 RepID=A0ABT8YEM7_9SPHN|nr:hypothetical protein [Sphingomonas sp. BIUV-7]MDO6416814.1 hypothetical protein [Sphingomonas sp. BIUV-7]
MLLLVQLDISQAEMALFDEYEARVLALLGSHGAKLVERLRSTDQATEVHLVHFPDASAFEAYRADPVRVGLQQLWLECGASSTLTEVRRVGET